MHGLTSRGAAGRWFFGVSALVAFSVAMAQPDMPQQLVDATVTSVSSGDTIMVSHGERRYKVWLDAVDAPEPGQVGFAEARTALSGLVLGRKVRVDACGPT